LIFFTVKNIVEIFNIEIDRIIKTIHFFVLINIVISIMAFLNPSIFQIFNTFFETSKTSVIGNSYERFAGTFSNPNFLGFFYSICCSYFVYALFTAKTNKIFHLVLIISSLYLVNISGSRSAL